MKDFMQSIVVNPLHFDAVLAKLRNSKYIAFDLETTGFSFLTEEICGIGLATINDDITEVTGAWYIPVMPHEDLDGYLDPELVWSNLKPIFLSIERLIIAHNLKFDMQFKLNVNIDLRPKLNVPSWFVPNNPKKELEIINARIKEGQLATCADTMVMSWLLNENKSKHGLKELAKEELGIDMTKFDKVVKGKKFNEVSIMESGPYALLDPIATAKLFIKYTPMLRAEKLEELFYRVEMPFVGVLQGIERRGMPVNRKVLETIGERCETEMAQLQQEIFKLAGKAFNINAGAQLAEILHHECRLPVLAKTPKGAIKVDASTLELLIEKGEFAERTQGISPNTKKGLEVAKLVLKFRKIKKVHGTYVEGILEKIDVDGRLHAGFHHTGTVTGRLSSSGPNLQNLPSGAIFTDYISVEEYLLHEGVAREKVEAYGGDEIDLGVELQKHFLFTVEPVKKDKKGKYEGCKPSEAEMYAIKWKIRDAFQEYTRDWYMIVNDYGQMELRMTAHLTGDAVMTQGFVDGYDIHKYNGSIVTGKPIDQVTYEERRDAKAVSFGLVYGKTVRGFALDWYGNEPDFWEEVPTKSAPWGKINKKYYNQTKVVVDRFFNGFPDVAEGIQQTHAFVERYGFVKMITGRKRRLPEAFSTNNGTKNKALRQAFNARVQGSSADFIKMAMIKLERELYIYQDPSTEYQQGQIAQVHDELLTVGKNDRIREMFKTKTDVLQNVIKLNCPITTDGEIGFKYGSCK